MKKLFINAKRDAYSPSDVGQTMTVAELIYHLNNFDKDSEVFFRFNDGYTYGRLNEFIFDEENDDNEDNEREE